ncbi:hypothetical protein N9D43_02135, partial [Luminiphilus sp.]|nr:hypothetical protein [Luminiphilus sp.]
MTSEGITMKKWLLCAWILGLFGCDGSVEGDVFIIKGNGDIAVSPGRTVTFIPGVSERTLFGQAASYAGEVALASIQDDLVAICPVAKESSDATLSGLAEEINAIKAKGSIPLEGCGKIEATSARLALEAGSEKERQTSETTRLSKNVASARSEKNRRVKEIVAGLKNEQMKRLTVTYRSNDADSVWTFTNNSDFCIGDADGYSFYFAADGFSNGIKTISAGDSKYGSSKDEYGFEMEGCFLPAGQSYTYKPILYGAPTTATPENRKAASEGKVRTYDCGPSYSRKVCIEVDSARWTSSYEFLEISRDDNGDSVVYSVTPVDWESKALSVEDFDAYDSRIQDAEDALARAKKRYSASSLLADADAAKN